jgi:transposase-like protein
MKPLPDTMIRIVSALPSLGSPLAAATLAVPSRARLSDDLLLWPIDSLEGASAPDISYSLSEFVKLVDQPDRDVLDFAHRFGFLGLCQAHDLPMLHPHLPGTSHIEGRPLSGPFCPPGVSLKPDLEFYETLQAWRFYSGHAAALLRLAAEVRNGRTGEPKDWKMTLGIEHPKEGSDRLSHLTEAVNAWLLLGSPRLVLISDRQGRIEAQLLGGLVLCRKTLRAAADVILQKNRMTWGPEIDDDFMQKLNQRMRRVQFENHPYAIWRKGRGTYRFWKPAIVEELRKRLSGSVPIYETGGLFPVLSAQLAMAISGGGGLVTCSACKSLYVPRRAPAAGRRHFCNDCGLKTARRFGKSDERNAKRLFSEGMAVPEIARILNKKLETVRRWTKGA